mmetsp:Transcript_3273/g.15494  ORF Transcript_3273/g.15494 Transcript_3273/m.15494 type:complete len:352 (-) Transcript_3273:501-1556(-)
MHTAQPGDKYLAGGLGTLLTHSYYDETDSSFLCAECALLCPARRGHVFRKVGQLKAELKKEIQSTFEEIDLWIESWKSQLRGIRQKSDKVLINSLDSIEQTTEIIGSQISRDHEEYTTSLRTQDQDLNYLNAWATNSITMIKYDVESSVETDLDSSEAGIRESLAEILSKVKATAQTNAESLAASFDTYQEGTFQPFVSKTFTMQLISSSPDGMEKSILSEPLMVFGLEWRLRIRYYLSDDGSDSKLPFGVFLTLSESTIDLEEVQFEYGVELLGAPVHNFSFRNTARFRRGDSWGRNRFCTMGDLRSLRSIGNGETRPSLEFRVQVRPSNLVLRCQLQQAYIKHLEMRVS